MDVSKNQMIQVIQELKKQVQNCHGNVKCLLKPIQIETSLMKSSQIAVI